MRGATDQGIDQGIHAKGLSKRYGKRQVVDAVELSVAPGEVVGLIGPNGAGKTTTFYMITGLVRADQGEIRLDGQIMTRLPIHKRARMGLSYLPQESSVMASLTVHDNLALIAEILYPNPSQRIQHIDHALEQMNLSSLRSQKAYTLSGGEKRRLEIARSLLTKPKFILMDEPFSGVDPIHIHELQSLILSLKAQGIGTLLTDHNVQETFKIVDRAYLLHEGKILLCGDAQTLLNDPQSQRFYLGRQE